MKKVKQKKLIVRIDKHGRVKFNWIKKESIAEVEKNVEPTITLV